MNKQSIKLDSGILDLITLPEGELIIASYTGEKLYKSEIEKSLQRAGILGGYIDNSLTLLLSGSGIQLPIACSNRGPMPEMLGDGGVYFDPQQPNEIADSIRLLLDDLELRECCARKAFKRSQEYSWDCCARETFSFLQKIFFTKS